MKVAIYGETKDVDEFLRSYNGEVSFCIEDIEKGRSLEKEGLGQFFTCYLRMAGSISKEDIYICLKDIPFEHTISLFKMGIYVIFANDFYVPAPVTSYDYSYRFEFEELSKVIEENNASFCVLPTELGCIDTRDIHNIVDISKNSCIELSKKISKFNRRTTSLDKAEFLSNKINNGRPNTRSCLNDLVFDIEKTANEVKEIIKYFQKKIKK